MGGGGSFFLQLFQKVNEKNILINLFISVSFKNVPKVLSTQMNDTKKTRHKEKKTVIALCTDKAEKE